MKVTKRKDPKNPIRVTLSDGTNIVVPRQGKFATTWLRKHGCPFVSQYEVMQFLGIKGWTVKELWRWAKKHVGKNFAATLTMRGERNCINHHIKGHGYAKFFAPKDITVKRMTAYLKAGAIIIITRRKPSIHYYVVFMDKGVVYALNYRGGGRVDKKSVKFLVSTRCLNSRYGGMIVITRKKGSPNSAKGSTPTKKEVKKAKKAKKKAAKKAKKAAKKGKKTNAQIVEEVINGKWGNGDERKKKLKAAGYDYAAIQKIVNKKLK